MIESMQGIPKLCLTKHQQISKATKLIMNGRFQSPRIQVLIIKIWNPMDSNFYFGESMEEKYYTLLTKSTTRIENELSFLICNETDVKK